MELLARTLILCGALMIAAWPAGAPAEAKDTSETFDPSIRSELREPVTLASKDGVLEVRLTVKQGEATLDTVAKPVQELSRLCL